MKKLFTFFAAVLMASSMMAEKQLATFSISYKEIKDGKVGTIALSTGSYDAQKVDDPATWYTCAKEGYTFKGAKVCMATTTNGGGLQMQGNYGDATKMGFFGNVTAFDNIHSVKVVLRTTSTSTYDPAFNVYTDSLRTTNVIASADTVKTTEGNFKKYVYTYTYAEPGKFFNIKNDLAGVLYIDTIYVTYEKEAPVINYWLIGTVAENEWDEKNATPMEDDAIVCHLAAGKYEFKVLSTLGSWEGALGYDNVDLEASSDNVYAAGAFGNIGFELEEEGDVTIAVVEGKIVVTGDFKKAEETVSLFGSFNGWGGQDMVVAEDGLTASLTLSLAADTKYEFKVVLNGDTWLTNSGTITRENCTGWTFEAKGDNCGIQTDVEGDYTFVYTIADSKLSVTYPTITAVENAAAAVKAVKVVENGHMIIIRDGKKFNALGAEL